MQGNPHELKIEVRQNMETIKEVKIIKPTKFGDDAEKIRVAAYCRVSTDSADQVNSFFAQMKYYNDYIRQNDKMIFVDIYADEGITGTLIEKRDEFKRLLNDCKNRKIDRVLVKSVTRFARNSLECIESVRQLKSYGTSVFFENDNIDTDRMSSEMVLYIKSAFAQGEALSASKRMSTSVRMRMENGTYILPNIPYGYSLRNGELVVIPEEASIVKEIFRMYLSGLGTSAIAKRCEKKSQKSWSRESLRYLLTNEKYVGDCLMQKTFTPNELPLRSQRNRGEMAKYYSQDTHAAIISKEDFEAVKALMREREQKYYKRKDSKRDFFYQKIKCRKCKWAYKRLMRSGELFWTCSRKGYAVDACHSLTYSDSEIRTAFVKMYNKLKQNQKFLLDETIAQLQALKVRINSGNDAIAEIDEQLASLAEQNNIYNNLFVGNIIDEITYHEKTDKLKHKMSELRDRRLKLINEDENEKCIENLRILKKIISESSDFMITMDENIFIQIIDSIYAETDGSLTFLLKGGLELVMDVR